MNQQQRDTPPFPIASRIAPGTMVRIIHADPYTNGVYKLIHAGEWLVFWQTPDDDIYSGAIINDDFFQGMINFYIDAIQYHGKPPFKEGK